MVIVVAIIAVILAAIYIPGDDWGNLENSGISRATTASSIHSRLHLPISPMVNQKRW